MQMLLDSPEGEKYIASLRRCQGLTGFDRHLVDADDRYPHYPVCLRHIVAMWQWDASRLTPHEERFISVLGGIETILGGQAENTIQTFLDVKWEAGLPLTVLEAQVRPRIGTLDELYALIVVKRELRTPLTRYEDCVANLSAQMKFRPAKAEALRQLTAHLQAVA